MRLCLILAVGLLPGCLTVRSVVIDGQEVQTSYLGPIALRQSSLPARPAVEFDENGKAIGVVTPDGLVALGVEFEFCGRKWIAEEMTVTADSNLPCGNGEVVRVELGGQESVRLIRIAVKADDGTLKEVDYDFNDAAPATP